MLKGILFDSDGVLVNSEEMYFKAVRNSFINYGVEISQDEYARRYMIEQTNTRGTINDYQLNIDIEEIRKLRDKFLLDSLKDLQMMPEALDLIQRLYGKYPLGLVTSASRKEASRKLEKFDLMKFFKISITGDDVTQSKPHPEPYQKACELLQILPQYVLVIEDNPTGVKSAKLAGCKVIARPHGFTKDMDFSLADIVIKEFSEINNELIGKLFQ